MNEVEARAVIKKGSKSFALASRLLPKAVRRDVHLLYAWCRRVDDRVDDAPSDKTTFEALERELDALFEKKASNDPLIRGLNEVFARHRIPREYPQELIEGMRMDHQGFRYRTMDDLLLYAFRVAGTVGLMMAHVLGAKRSSALKHAAHLGMAMQLTNIARDVKEDLGRGRIYVPSEILGELGLPSDLQIKGTPTESIRRAFSCAVARLLLEADVLYASGALGFSALPTRSAVAVAAASRIYSAIGSELENRGYDPFYGRVIVPTGRKLVLALRGLFDVLAERKAAQNVLVTAATTAPSAPLRFPRDFLPI